MRFWLIYLGYAIYIVLLINALSFFDLDIRYDSALFLAGWLLGAAAVISATIRRLHDRARSAWWMIVFFILPPALVFAPFFPLMNALQTHRISEQLFDVAMGTIVMLCNIPLWWGFIEIGFLRGTQGQNRFGPDPLVPSQ